MSKSSKRTAIVLLLLGVLAGASACVMEDRVVEIVLNDTTCQDFMEYHAVVSFTTAATMNYAEELNMILEDNDVSREDIVAAHLVSASYAVTSFSHTHDWTIAGAMTVKREDILASTAETLWNYTGQSVQGALDAEVPVSFEAGGVAVINGALADFIAGGNPVLTFTVENSDVSPPPSVADPIQFEWRACITIQVVTRSDVEVPDPL